MFVLLIKCDENVIAKEFAVAATVGRDHRSILRSRSHSEPHPDDQRKLQALSLTLHAGRSPRYVPYQAAHEISLFRNGSNFLYVSLHKHVCGTTHALIRWVAGKNILGGPPRPRQRGTHPTIE